jgi:hypothetical protein
MTALHDCILAQGMVAGNAAGVRIHAFTVVAGHEKRVRCSINCLLRIYDVALLVWLSAAGVVSTSGVLDASWLHACSRSSCWVVGCSCLSMV